MIDTKELARPPQAGADLPGSLDVALASAKTMPDPANLTLLVAAIAQVSEAVLITDTSGIIQYVNPAFTQMTGYSAEEALGQNTRLLKSDRQDPVYYRKLWQTILAGKVWRGELLNRRKDGTVYAEEMSITPVRDGNGAVSHFIAIKKDLSEYRATREALRSSEQRFEEIQRITPLGSYRADLVSNGAEALRLLGQNDYDLVLMDCGMPEMDGYEATRRIRDGRAPTPQPPPANYCLHRRCHVRRSRKMPRHGNERLPSEACRTAPTGCHSSKVA